jgi:PAS domain S-box-containing protein
MNIPEEERYHANLLRQRAEKALRGEEVEVSKLSPEDFQHLLHELQVHQAELSIQNEELHQAQRELEASRDLYSDLYNFAPAGYCTLSQKDTILEANQTLAMILGFKREELMHQALSHFIDRDSQDEYYLYRQRAFEDHQQQIGKIYMVKQNGEKILIRLESRLVPGDQNRLRVMLSDITEQQRIEKEAQEAAALRELRRRASDHREQERHRIARDLHEGPVQNLIATTYALHLILADTLNPELAERLGAIQRELQAQVNELRAYSVELRPPMISNFGLEKAICTHAEAFQEKHPAIQVTLELQQDAPLLEEKISMALFRIYQEALNNVIRHVQRPHKQVIVRLDQDEKQVQLEIQDNGQGFDLSEPWINRVRDGHLGLVGMQERAESVGGQLEIHSTQEIGTRVVVSVPLEADGKAE